MIVQGMLRGERKLVLFMLVFTLMFAAVASAASSSTPYATMYWGNNKYYLTNNTWGSDTAGSGWWQSIYYNSNTNMGFSWDWKYQNPYNVKGYPSIVSGWQWTNGYTAGSGFPTRIWDNKNINASVNYSISASGAYNAAYDLWFHTTNNAQSNSTPSDEIMIWLNNTNAGPMGTYQETVWLAGAQWDLYKGMHSSGWNVFSFVRKGNTSSSSMNLRDFIHHIVYSKGWMSNSKYVSSVQFGTEVFTGSGNMHISNYSVNVQ